jgi:hypothetical protein
VPDEFPEAEPAGPDAAPDVPAEALALPAGPEELAVPESEVDGLLAEADSPPAFATVGLLV